jgi:DNA topoisomerase-3
MCKEVDKEGKIVCISVNSMQKTKTPPEALNTVQLLKHCSAELDIGPSDAMRAAESLYLQGYISYPRTESTRYPDSFDFDDLVSKFVNHDEDYGDFAKAIRRKGIRKPENGRDLGDHPPILPQKPATERELGAFYFLVYDYVVRHFLASISPPCEYTEHNVEWEACAKKFSSSSISIEQIGFTEILQHMRVAESFVSGAKAPEKGQSYPVKCEVESGMTKPPPHLSESELISLMEENGIVRRKFFF